MVIVSPIFGITAFAVVALAAIVTMIMMCFTREVIESKSDGQDLADLFPEVTTGHDGSNNGQAVD